MKFLSKFFGTGLERELKDKLGKIHAEVEREYKPLGEIGIAIIVASDSCSKAIKPFVKGADEKKTQELNIYVFYEFIYFFMHMTMRTGFSRLNELQLQRLQEYLGPLISQTAIDSFFRHWPDDLKAKMRTEFYEKVNDAELDYGTSKVIFSKEELYTSDSLFSKLARNVSELNGSPMDPAIMTAVLAVSLEAFTNMKLDQLILNASKVL